LVINNLQHIKYRSDIDGLRAVAVLSVIFFHINANWIPGGFLGVDVFFVLSGYLITLILIKEVSETHKIDMVNFYKRRIKRIVPALMFVLVPTFVVGCMLFTPEALLALAKSMISSVLFSANLYFFFSIDTGYFAQSSHSFPLLHLWSLGVEEQFYILWPFAVLFLFKYVPSLKGRVVFTGILFVSSLILAQSIITTSHSFAYYMLPTRAWELLAGSITALLVYTGFRSNSIVNEIMAFIGLLAIILSFIFVSGSDSVPGIAAIPVIIGTVFLILSGVSYKTFPARLLSLKVFVAIGLISYSAYLWHWPILALLHYALIEIDIIVSVGVVFITLTLATGSYFLVEKPFRKNHISTNRVFTWYFIIPTTLIILASTVVIEGVKSKSDFIFPWGGIDKIYSDTQGAYAYNYNCQFSHFDIKSYAEGRCVYPANVKKANMFLIGDSNAAHYLGLLRVFSKRYGFSLRNATQSSCPLVFEGEYDWIYPKYQEGCSIYRHSVFSEAIKYDTVTIGLSWDSYFSKPGFHLEFERSIEQLSSNVKKIILLGKVPRFRSYSKECEIRSIRLGELQCSTRFNNTLKEHKVNQWLRELASKYPNIEYFGVHNQLCSGDECSPYLDGKPVYFNGGHLSMKGSELIGMKMLDEKAPMLDVFMHLQGLEQVYHAHIAIIDNDDLVEFSLKPKQKGKQIAFYLYKDGEHVDTQRYSKEHLYRLRKKKYGKGEYRVKFFIVNNVGRTSKSKKKRTGYSNSYVVK